MNLTKMEKSKLNQITELVESIFIKYKRSLWDLIFYGAVEILARSARRAGGTEKVSDMPLDLVLKMFIHEPDGRFVKARKMLRRDDRSLEAELAEKTKADRKLNVISHLNSYAEIAAHNLGEVLRVLYPKHPIHKEQLPLSGSTHQRNKTIFGKSGRHFGMNYKVSLRYNKVGIEIVNSILRTMVVSDEAIKQIEFILNSDFEKFPYPFIKFLKPGPGFNSQM